jgi:hypothetical protein
MKRLRCKLGIHNKLTRKLMKTWVDRPGYFLRCRDCDRIVRGKREARCP